MTTREDSNGRKQGQERPRGSEECRTGHARATAGGARRQPFERLELGGGALRSRRTACSWQPGSQAASKPGQPWQKAQAHLNLRPQGQACAILVDSESGALQRRLCCLCLRLGHLLPQPAASTSRWYAQRSSARVLQRRGQLQMAGGRRCCAQAQAPQHACHAMPAQQPTAGSAPSRCACPGLREGIPPCSEPGPARKTPASRQAGSGGGRKCGRGGVREQAAAGVDYLGRWQRRRCSTAKHRLLACAVVLPPRHLATAAHSQVRLATEPHHPLGTIHTNHTTPLRAPLPSRCPRTWNSISLT